jgi:hypothetical protein
MRELGDGVMGLPWSRCLQGYAWIVVRGKLDFRAEEVKFAAALVQIRRAVALAAAVGEVWNKLPRTELNRFNCLYTYTQYI